jgi:hypothetical protein
VAKQGCANWNIHLKFKFDHLKTVEIAETVQQAAKKTSAALCVTSAHPCGSGFNLSFVTGIDSKPMFFPE